jgi:hypothetical protein
VWLAAAKEGQTRDHTLQRALALCNRNGYSRDVGEGVNSLGVDGINGLLPQKVELCAVGEEAKDGQRRFIARVAVYSLDVGHMRACKYVSKGKRGGRTLTEHLGEELGHGPIEARQIPFELHAEEHGALL